MKSAPLFVGITGQLQHELSDAKDGEAQMHAARLWKLLADLPTEPTETVQAAIDFSTPTPSADASTCRSRPNKGGFFSGRARPKQDASHPQSSWHVRPFLVHPEHLPSMERRAIEYLFDFGDLRLSEMFAQQPLLSKYFHQEVKSWVLQNSSRTVIAKLDFLELFFPFAGNSDTDAAIDTAKEWYNEMAGDSPCVDFEKLVLYIIRKEHLLQAIIRRRLFIGSISGGVGSFQLTLATQNNEDRSEAERHSAPCGSTSPMTGDGLAAHGVHAHPLFQQGRRVTKDQLCKWQEHLRNIITDTSTSPIRSSAAGHGGVGGCSWPTQRRGVFVGIAGMFFAADAAGIAARFISRDDALESFERVLAEEIGGTEPRDIAKHQQKVANVAIYLEVVRHVLHEDAWLYAQREWRLSDTEKGHSAHGGAPMLAVATWSLGWFLMGSMPDQADESSGMQPDLDRRSSLSRLMTSLYREPDIVQSRCSWCCGASRMRLDDICRGWLCRCRRRQRSYT